MGNWRRFWRFLDERVSSVALAVVLIGFLVGAVGWAYHQQAQLNDAFDKLAAIRGSQVRHSPDIASSARNSARAAADGKKAVSVVNEIPAFYEGLVTGQRTISAQYSWIECALQFGAARCGPAPAGLPAPATTTTTVPAHP